MASQSTSTRSRRGARSAAVIGVTAALAVLTPGRVVAAPLPAVFSSAVAAIEALPYQQAYVPVGDDSAFASNTTPVVNTLPATDYTTGSIPGSDPTGATDTPPWPSAFHSVTITSTDGAEIQGMEDIAPGNRPGVLVVHGFNTHGYDSVIRWAAMLAANGYDVAAFDQRDYYFEDQAHEGEPNQQQTFGWKEAQDVLTAGTWLSQQTGVTSVGVVGFSEGAQNTVLAVSRDSAHVFSAGITFSGPADQDTQVYSTKAPGPCATPTSCTYPATDGLIAVVVPPYGTYTDPCSVLTSAATLYHTTAYDILTQETAMHAQTAATIPLLNFYSADDSLVAPYNATFMDAYELGNPLQRTIEIQHGEHAYFFDRWWQQSAILTYFKSLLVSDATVTSNPTVNQTAGGATVASQEVSLGTPTRAGVDAQLAPFICDTTQAAPGLQSAQPESSLPEGNAAGLLSLGGVAAAAVLAARRRARAKRVQAGL